MKFACMSCSAKYSIPSRRIMSAGDEGLRVRCSRCRAIMVVSAGAANLEDTASGELPTLRVRRAESEGSAESAMAASSIGEDQPTPRALPRPASFGGGGGSSAGLAEVRDLPPHLDSVPPLFEAEAPAELSGSGVYRPVAGVQRAVTGMFFPELQELEDNKSSRTWYAAFGGRSRGPFSSAEMVTLASQGKVRDSNWVWRPGFASWRRVKDGAVDEDLAWLRRHVVERKRKEKEAQQKAKARLGIEPVALMKPTLSAMRSTSSLGSSRGVSPSQPPRAGASFSPPPLPRDAYSDGTDDRSGEIALAMGPAVPQGPSDDVPGPFLWKLDGVDARAVGTRQGASPLAVGVVTGLALGALVLVVGVALLFWGGFESVPALKNAFAALRS